MRVFSRLYRVLLVLGLATSIIAAGPDLLGAEGQATAKPGTKLFGLQPGESLYGPAFDNEQHLGKVVVVNMGGA